MEQYISEISVNRDVLKVETLCQSLCGNDVKYLIISNNIQSLDLKNSRKKVIFLTGRVHPGESNCSYIIEGIVNYLITNKNSPLLNEFIFIIIPMLNPDGVVYGNYRCSVLGVDLNRR